MRYVVCGPLSQTKNFSGPMFVELISQYVARINAGGVPCIGSAWASVSTLAAQAALEDAVKKYVDGVNARIKQLPVETGDGNVLVTFGASHSLLCNHR